MMMEFNYVAVAIATLLSFFGGFIWYSVLFSKPWMAALGIRREDVDGSGMSIFKAVFASIVASLATALGLAFVLGLVEPQSWLQAWGVAVLLWLCFSVNAMFKMIFWEDRPVVLFMIDGGYELFSLSAAASIIFILA